jgi:hypothetical protein
MKLGHKAILLSVIVYPGLGHFTLKKKLIGLIFVCAFSVLLLLTLHDIFALAQCVANDVISGKIPLDIATITQAVHQPSEECKALTTFTYLPFMIIVWVFSVIDVYRIGRKSVI